MRKNFFILALALFFVTAFGVNAWAQASINLIKSVSVDDGATWHNADTIIEAPTATVGQGVMYKMEVTNDGDQDLDSVWVEDELLGIVGEIGDVGPLLIGETVELLPTNIEQLNQLYMCVNSGEFENIATPYFIYNEVETESLPNSAWVICSESVSEGCTRTFGYWKTHSYHGPAPYDDTWALLEHGDNTPFFGTNMSYYDILMTKPTGGNAYIILAHQFIAAELNMLSNASMSDTIIETFDEASALLNKEKYKDTHEIPKKDSDRTLAIEFSKGGVRNGPAFFIIRPLNICNVS